MNKPKYAKKRRDISWEVSFDAARLNSLSIIHTRLEYT